MSLVAAGCGGTGPQGVSCRVTGKGCIFTADLVWIQPKRASGQVRSFQVLFRDPHLLGAGASPEPTHQNARVRDGNGFTPSPGRTTEQACETYNSLTRMCSEASCCLSVCLTTTRPDLRWVQFRLVHPPRVCVFILHENISAWSTIFVVFFCLVPHFSYDAAFAIVSFWVVISN